MRARTMGDCRRKDVKGYIHYFTILKNGCGINYLFIGI
jgi:hypothetical protein